MLESKNLLKNFNDLSAKQLKDLDKQAGWSLNVLELQAVQKYFKKNKRNPDWAELETIAQTWSEHCKHKTFNSPIKFNNNGKTEYVKNGLFKDYIAKATKDLNKSWCLSVFKDNAGVVEFGTNKKWGLAFKAETHNHPCAIEPYGGAETGVGGVVRDILGVGLGAKPVVNTDIFCFADPKFNKKLPAHALHPKRIFKGVVKGVKDYGNRMGIPTASGAIWFDDSYALNPLVFVGTIGIMPRWAVEKEVKAGDIVLVIGGRTGRDGIHGATFSSATIEDTVEISAVQIGHAINEKKFLDVLMELRDKKLYRGLTDCGAGGFSSAIGELGEETGVKVDMKKAKLKDSNIVPWEIWISESQERMVLSVPPKNLPKIKKILEREDCEYCELGKFTNTKRLEVFFGTRKLIDMDMKFLHGGVPSPELKANYKKPNYKTLKFKNRTGKDAVKYYGDMLNKTLSHLNTCSRESVIRQYDHEVQAGLVIKPLQGISHDGPGDASVVWPHTATGDLNDYSGFAISHGLNPKIGALDGYQMALNVIDESIRNLLCVGADISKTAILDNFCMASPENPKVMGDLVLMAQGCYDGSMGYQAPFISGKDSFYNQSKGADGKDVGVLSTLLISATAPVKDVHESITMDLKKPDSSLYLVGETKSEMGATIFADIEKLPTAKPPCVDMKVATKSYQQISKAMSEGIILSAHDCSQGGLATALAEMSFSGGYGAMIDLSKVPSKNLSDTELLFSESASRIILEVDNEDEAEFKKLMKGTKFAKIGEAICEPSLKIQGLSGEFIIDEKISKLKSSWQKTLKDIFK